MNHLKIKVCQSLRRFSQKGRLLKSFVKICNIEVHENSTDVLVVDVL